MQFERTRRHPFEMTPWVLRLIIANAVVHLLQMTVFTGPWLVRHFGFAPQRFVVQPWSAITYMFLHGGMLHLFFNMLVLFFFGPAVEDRMGSREFLKYYSLCGLGGAALSFVFAFQTPTIIGASGAVFGVSLAFAVYWPDARVFVFPIPVPIKVKWLVGFLGVSALVYAVLGVEDGTAHFAHLGGFGFGALYLLHRRGVFSQLRSPKPANKPPKVFAQSLQRRSRTEREASIASRKQSRWHDDQLSREVDRVLDKISDSGMDSLTKSERDLLDSVSKKMREH